MTRTALAIGLATSLLGSIVLGGCSSDKTSTAYDAPKPLDKMSKEEWCDYYSRFLSNPQLSPSARALDLQRMRSRGCATPAG